MNGLLYAPRALFRKGAPRPHYYYYYCHQRLVAVLGTRPAVTALSQRSARQFPQRELIISVRGCSMVPLSSETVQFVFSNCVITISGRSCRFFFCCCCCFFSPFRFSGLERERDRQTDRDRETDTDRQTDRQRETDRQRWGK